MPDATGIFLVASSWTTQWAGLVEKVSPYFKAGMFCLSALLTTLAIVDYSMKISWKLKQRKRSKLRCSCIEECANIKALKEEYK